MCDAAAKFLVQFPDQSLGEHLAKGEAVTVEPKVASADAGGIETVPIEEGPTTVDATPAAVAPAAPVAAPPIVPKSFADGSLPMIVVALLRHYRDPALA